MKNTQKKQVNDERLKILQTWEKWFEIPLIVLGFLWLVIVIVELTTGLSPLLENLSFAIWIVFILDFIVRFSIAPFKIAYLKSEWIVVIALVIPAFRLLRSFSLLRNFRFFRLAKSINLIRVIAAMRQGTRLLATIFGRHGFGYIIGLTCAIALLGAAGIQSLESHFKNYGDALWWSAMIITTMGSDFWPETPEGRILCLVLAVYSFAVFGYITANLASFLIEKETKNRDEKQKILNSMEELKLEIKDLRNEISVNIYPLRSLNSSLKKEENGK